MNFYKDNIKIERSEKTLAMIDECWKSGQMKLYLNSQQSNDMLFASNSKEQREAIDIVVKLAVLKTGKFATYKKALEIRVK